MTGQGGDNMALADALADSGHDFQQVSRLHKQDFEGGVRALLRRAQDAGAVRADVEPGDVLMLLGSACRAASTDDGARERSRRLIGVVADGLRA